MSDKKTTLTPIIVGAVIALLGILTGLYIATNAREGNLSSANAEEQSLTESQSAAESPTSEEMSEVLPDLPAVDDTPVPVIEEPVEEEAVPEIPETPETPQVTTVETEQGEPDDFEPVSPEEIEKAIPQQEEHKQDTI